mmetsp:Transcript_10097/g.17039  ORF Transcript_10097/g.17039 Transcript_10097/m.17039 type:complete len:157 (+) Transcript_10097:363-833(+)
MSDDLIEQADKQIDIHKKQKSSKSAERAPQSQQDSTNPRALKTDNSLRKPQLAWQASIDNSYHPFIPTLKQKPHGKSEIHKSIVLAQKDLEENNTKYKSFGMSDSKAQEDPSQWYSLPNPYHFEIEQLDSALSHQTLLDLFKSQGHFEDGGVKVKP